MAYIPKDTEWFIADLVAEIRVQGYKRNIVHIKYVLIHAKNPAEAYREAMKLGKRANQTYETRTAEWYPFAFSGCTIWTRFLTRLNTAVRSCLLNDSA